MQRFAPKHGSAKPKQAERYFCRLLLAIGLVWLAIRPVHAEPVPLHLEVYVNGQSTHLIAAFKQHEDGRFSTTLSELKDLRLKPTGARPDGDLVYLDDISGLSYKYDEATQVLHVTTGNANREAKNYSAIKKKEKLVSASSDLGLVFNYAVNATGTNTLKLTTPGFDGLSAIGNARIYGPYGVLTGSGIVNVGGSARRSFTRLETTWRYSDTKRLLTYSVGDVITKGPSWARPVRLGGASVSRNFTLRPDLVTVPVARVSGSAAVPSTVDVYVNNVKAHSQDVESGPFTLSNIPSVSGSGTARVVVRDATGHETVSYSEFFTSSHLLARGMWDYSLEVGLPRGNYGQKSFDYGKKPYLSGNARYGWSDKLTFDGHIEAGFDLIMAGGGITMPLFNKALVTVSGAGSFHKGGSGFLAAASVETSLLGMTINARSQRTFGDFADIAAISANDFTTLTPGITNAVSGTSFPTAIDQIAIGVPLRKWSASFNTSFLHTKSETAGSNNILTLGFTKNLFSRASLYATAFADVKKLSSPSAFVGISIPLGAWGSASVGGARNAANGWRATTTYSKPMSNEIGSFGWRIQDQEGDSSLRNAAASYRSSAMTLEGRLSQTGKDLEYSAYANGAVVLNRAGVFATNRIDDSFAVVKVGAANVPVRFENRLVGKTGSSGTLLIPDLNSYDRNKIAIDIDKLPVNAKIPKTSQVIVPAYKSGVIVDFGVDTKVTSAIVIVHDRNGKPLQAGIAGKLNETDGEVYAGFDGRVFAENLSATNKIVFATESGPCSVEFELKPSGDGQPEIGPLTCH